MAGNVGCVLYQAWYSCHGHRQAVVSTLHVLAVVGTRKRVFYDELLHDSSPLADTATVGILRRDRSSQRPNNS